MVYGRATIVEGKPERIDAGLAQVREKVAPAVDNIPGCFGVSAWANRETGRCVVITGWVDEASMIASAEKVKPLRDEAVATLEGDARVELWELAAMHQVGGDQPGYVTRSVLMSGDPAMIDKGIELFRTQVIPNVSKIPGFNTISLMVDRKGGRSRVNTTYTSRAAAEAARDAAAEIRKGTAAQLGLTIEEIDELEVMIVGLRNPNEIPQQQNRTVELPTEHRV